MELTPIVEPAHPDEQADALFLLFRDLPPQERERRVTSALSLLQSGQLDPAGLLIERGPDGPVGVLVCLPVPGGSALFWPPRSVTDVYQLQREDRLLKEGIRWVCDHGAKLSQSLLTTDEMPLAAALERNGFRHITRLWYLARDLEVSKLDLSVPAHLDYSPYDPDQPELFHQTLLRTYEGTHDCPEINGVRTIEEVTTGHRAQGRFDPNRWWLAIEDGREAGILLIAEMPENKEWDISYLGVVPEARRRGFGRELLCKAILEAKIAGARNVTLSVDARNEPALQLYRDFGFVPYDRREVYLAIWR